MSNHTNNRRNFLKSGAGAAAGLAAAQAAAAGGTQDHAHPPDHAMGADAYPRDRPGVGGPVGSAGDRGKLVPGLRPAGSKRPEVIIPDNPAKPPFALKDGVKEFHLHCGHTRREVLPDIHLDVWGFNGGMPGPTIEAEQGDRVRIVVHNDLPESTGIHWHGLELPVGMDGVPGLTQPPLPPGGVQAFEFTLHQSGTYFYHSHDGMQDGMGMVGLFLIHPKAPEEPRIDKDFALLIQEWAVLPGSTIPNTMSMEFNLFTLNGRAGPFITPMVCRLGERVRLRIVNFSGIDHHPMHLHGLTFWVTGTEAGRIPESAWIPGNTVLIGVAQAREIEFIANNPGDWMLHCHMFHHVMNFMSSMVGPMGGHEMEGMRAGMSPAAGMGVATGGPAMSDDFGPSLGRSMGEQTGLERAVGNTTVMPPMRSGHAMHRGRMPGRRVPGYPQGMLDMPMNLSASALRKINGKRETQGMRADWHTGVTGLMSVVRVLPPELYDKVMAGAADIPAGASVPGGPIGEMPIHEHEY